MIKVVLLTLISFISWGTCYIYYVKEDDLLQKFKKNLIENEGLSLKPYKDAHGYWTICSGQRYILTSNGSKKAIIISKSDENTMQQTKESCDFQSNLMYYYYSQQAQDLIGETYYNQLTPQEKLFLIDSILHNGKSKCRLIKKDFINWINHRTPQNWKKFQYTVLNKLNKGKSQTKVGFSKRRKKMLANIIEEHHLK